MIVLFKLTILLTVFPILLIVFKIRIRGGKEVVIKVVLVVGSTLK